MPDTFTSGHIVLTPDVIFQLDRALRKAGYEPRDMYKLRNPKALGEVLAYLRGEASFTKLEYAIDLDAYPLIDDDDWKCEKHRKGGKFWWDPSKIELRRDFGQSTMDRARGWFLEDKFSDISFNATLLDRLKYNKDGRVPADWIGKKVVCWGSVFWWSESREPTRSYVRYLDCTGDLFSVEAKSLDEFFDDTFYAAVRIE